MLRVIRLVFQLFEPLLEKGYQVKSIDFLVKDVFFIKIY